MIYKTIIKINRTEINCLISQFEDLKKNLNGANLNGEFRKIWVRKLGIKENKRRKS